MNFKEALTYDDVLLVPRRSFIDHRGDIDISTKLTKNISLKMPLISANMDSVTESEMAIAMARMGGLGVIHRFMTVERQVAEVVRVKRSEGFVVDNPYTISVDATLKMVWAMTEETGVHSFVVLDEQGIVVGLVTKQQTMFETDSETRVKDIMVKGKDLILAKPTIGFKQAKEIFKKHKITKLPLVDGRNRLKGLITARSVMNNENFPDSTKDERGRYMVGAAVGVVGDFMERSDALVKVGCNVLVVDIAHGHNAVAIRAIKKIKKKFPKIDVVGGNVATAEGTLDLIVAGADAVKVGIGPGGLCTTRIVAGVGVPQLSAVMESAKVAKKYGVPIIADGGANYPGDMVKALAGGASTCMLAGWFAGTDESPGGIIMRKGLKYKAHRGSASFMANADRKLALEKGMTENKLNSIVAEGVEAVIPYKGAVGDVIFQLKGSIRSGMSYCNAKNIQALWKNAQFVKISSAGFRESKSHNVQEV